MTRTLGPTRALLLAALLLGPSEAPAAEPAQAPAAVVLAAAPQTTWIAEGRGRHAVYIFFDPNCPACRLLYMNLRPFIAAHDLQLRWIPVAVVNATSAGKAAAILQAPDPVAALRQNKEHYRGDTYSGGIQEDIPTTDTEQKLRANERLLNQLNIPVVPSLLFADKDRGAVLIQGALSPVALDKVFARLPPIAPAP